jgi:hypothetical protein
VASSGPRLFATASRTRNAALGPARRIATPLVTRPVFSDVAGRARPGHASRGDADLCATLLVATVLFGLAAAKLGSKTSSTDMAKRRLPHAMSSALDLLDASLIAFPQISPVLITG